MLNGIDEEVIKFPLKKEERKGRKNDVDSPFNFIFK